MYRQTGGSADLDWMVLTIAHGQLGQTRAMRRAAEQSIATARSNGGETGAEYSFAVSSYGMNLLAAGLVDEAIPVLRDAIDLRSKVAGSNHESVRSVRARLAEALALRGDPDRAEGMVQELEREQAAAGRAIDPSQIAITGARVACAMARGRFAEALAAQRQLVASDAKGRRPDDWQAVANRLDLAELLLQCGEPDAASEVAAVELAGAAPVPDTMRVRRHGRLRARLQAHRGEGSAAVGELEERLAELQGAADPDSVLLATACEDFVEVLLDQRAFPRAAEVAAIAVRARATHAFPRWRLDADRALLALARRGDGGDPAAAAAFAAAWRGLALEPALPPALRSRFTAAQQ